MLVKSEHQKMKRTRMVQVSKDKQTLARPPRAALVYCGEDIAAAVQGQVDLRKQPLDGSIIAQDTSQTQGWLDKVEMIYVIHQSCLMCFVELMHSVQQQQLTEAQNEVLRQAKIGIKYIYFKVECYNKYHGRSPTVWSSIS